MNWKANTMASSLKAFFFPSNIASLLFTLSFSQWLFNHISLPDPESYLCNRTISKEKNCVVNCRTFGLFCPGMRKKAAHGSLHGPLEPEKQYVALLTLQPCISGSGSLAAQLCFYTSTIPKKQDQSVVVLFSPPLASHCGVVIRTN